MIGDSLKARFEAALDRRFTHLATHLDGRIDALEEQLDDERNRRIEAEQALERAIASVDQSLNGDLTAVVRAIASEEPRNRRALYDLRLQPDYELPFSEATPLISICISTISERRELLLERALPSALAQSYDNIEVVVIGNAVGDEFRAALTKLADDRVRFTDLTHRVAHHDPEREWLKAATMSRNEAHRQAQGLWITDLDDDDALKPDAVARLVELAQAQHVEVAYGLHEQHHPDGKVTNVGAFPPGPIDNEWKEHGLPREPWQGFASNGAIWHEGLRLFAREHIAAELNIPGDYFRLERMVRAGVRFAMLDRPVYEYWPSTLWRK